jgi:hypothetical protein
LRGLPTHQERPTARGEARPRVNVCRIPVMRGLDPRIHHLRKMMDCRVKPGNDQEG